MLVTPNSDIVQILETQNTEQCSDLKELAQSALLSFSIIKSWFMVQTTDADPLVASLKHDMSLVADTYFRAVTQSLQTAQDGIVLSKDAIDLCDFISRGETMEAISSFVTSMRELAEDGYRSSLTAYAHFRDVRQIVFEMAKTIPQKAEYATQHREGGRKSPTPSILSPDSLRDKAPRKTESESNFDISYHLRRAEEDFKKIAENTGKFVNWWNEIKMQLNSIEASAPLIKKSDPLRIQSIRARWQEVSSNYYFYQSKISLIQDYFPDIHAGSPETVHVDLDSNTEWDFGSRSCPRISDSLSSSSREGFASSQPADSSNVRKVIPTLSNACTLLAENFQLVMEALYHPNWNNSNLPKVFRQNFEKYRESIRAEWKPYTSFLESSATYADEMISFWGYIMTEPWGKCLQFASPFHNLARNNLVRVRELLKTHEELSKSILGLTKHLNVTQTVYPTPVEAEVKKIGQALTNFIFLWDHELEDFHCFISQPTVQSDQAKAQHSLETWKTYRNALQAAISRISLASDSVTIRKASLSQTLCSVFRRDKR